MYPFLLAATLHDWYDAGIALHCGGRSVAVPLRPESRDQSRYHHRTGARQRGEDVIFGMRLSQSCNLPVVLSVASRSDFNWPTIRRTINTLDSNTALSRIAGTAFPR